MVLSGFIGLSKRTALFANGIKKATRYTLSKRIELFGNFFVKRFSVRNSTM